MPALLRLLGDDPTAPDEATEGVTALREVSSWTRPDAESDELAARLLELPADALLRVVGRAEQLREHRAVDGGLRADVLRALDRAVAAGRISAAGAASVRDELDEATPSAVLEAHAAELIEDRPLGAFPRAREGVEPPDLDAWLASDPRRLGRIVAEAARSGST